jgi:hypothetical protein
VSRLKKRFRPHTLRGAEFARVCLHAAAASICVQWRGVGEAAWPVRLNERSAAMLTGARAIKVKVALSETGACVGGQLCCLQNRKLQVHVSVHYCHWLLASSCVGSTRTTKKFFLEYGGATP